jgi:hypothetical protein
MTSLSLGKVEMHEMDANSQKNDEVHKQALRASCELRHLSFSVPVFFYPFPCFPVSPFPIFPFHVSPFLVYIAPVCRKGCLLYAHRVELLEQRSVTTQQTLATVLTGRWRRILQYV